MTQMRKRYVCVACAVLLVLSLAGCASGMIPIGDDRKNDTVVFIPLDPEKAVTIPETRPAWQEVTEAPAVDSTTPETEAPPTQQPDGGSSTSGPDQPAPPATECPNPPSATESTAAAPEPTIYDISGYGVGALEQQIFGQINTLRAEQNLAALYLDSRLCAIASARAWELETLWSHTRPNGLGFSTIGADYGYSGYIAAENLFYNGAEPSAQEVVQGWMNGAAQRDNVLSAGYTVVGIGVYRANGTVYIACLFVG